MKNNVMHLFCFTAMVLLASSFVKQPVPVEASKTRQEVKSTLPFGGVYILFAGKFGGEISRQQMNGQTEIKVEGCHKDARISGFTLVITKSSRTTTLTSTSKLLSAEMRSILSSLSKGDKFEFRDAKAFLPEHKEQSNVLGCKFVVV